MGCRDFESGSSNYINSASTGWASLGNSGAWSAAALCTVESLPIGTGSVIVGIDTSAGAGCSIFGLDSTVGTWAATSGTTGSLPSSSIIPPTGVVVIGAVSKPAGSSTATYMGWRLDTGEFTFSPSAATMSDRTTGAQTGIVGGISAFSAFHDGQIGAVAMWNRALSEAEMRTLPQGRAAWRSLFGRGVVTNNAEMFVDLTIPGTIRDQMNPAIAWTTGTIPAFGPDVIRFPGW